MRVPAGYYRAEGMIKNVNTIEEYKELDKINMLQQTGKTVGNSPPGYTKEKVDQQSLSDMGGYQRRHHLLMSIASSIIPSSLLRRSEEV